MSATAHQIRPARWFVSTRPANNWWDHVTAPIEASLECPTQIIDYEYVRNGTANIFMLYAPLEGRREAIVTNQRTTIDYAHTIRYSQAYRDQPTAAQALERRDDHPNSANSAAD